MIRWQRIIIFFGILVSGLILANGVRAASGTSCDNFNGTIPEPPNDATCTLWASATDPENDRVYYVFTWGDGTTTRVPNASLACAGEIGANATVPSGTECSADHTYTTSGNPFTVFATAYDEANHESVASASVPAFITSQVLSVSLVGTPSAAGWYNYTTFDYTTNCTADAGFTLNYCRTEVSINNGAWVIIPGGNPGTLGQTTFTYNGSYTYPTDGAGYRFRSTADDTGPTPPVFSALVPPSGQIQIDQSVPLAAASSPGGDQAAPFVVSATLVDYPNPGVGPNSGVSTWDLQYRAGSGGTWTNCLVNIAAGQSSVSFGGGCSPTVTLVPNTTYCFRARARDSTNPTQNQSNYTSATDGDSCTRYQVSSPPIAPHTPSPGINALVSATNINLQWYGGDPDASESLDYSVYISQPGPPVPNITISEPCIPGEGDCDGVLENQLPCSSQLPQGCQVTYGAPQNRTPQPGEVYSWRVRVTDGFNNVDSTPIPWSFIVNSPPIISNVNIVPATVNTSGTITWRVVDQNDSQSLSFNVYYGAVSGTISGATLIAGGLTTADCSGGPNSSGWDCTYVWDTSCVPQISSQYITITASDGLDSGLGSSAATFAVNHTETRYYPGPGNTNYDTATDREIKNFPISYGSIESGSSFIRFVGTCSSVKADANAPGNVASCGGSGPACSTSPDVPLEDLLPGSENYVTFGLEGCVSTQYRIRYDLVAACEEPYLSVEQGSIYSQGNIRAQYTPPEGSYNATYLILGGGTAVQPRVIENFITAPPPSGIMSVNPSFGQLAYPGTTSSPSPQVSSFDYYGLTHDLSGAEVNNGGTNSYGHQVSVITNTGGDVLLSDVVGAIPAPLGAKVHWVKDNLVVNQSTEFANGIGGVSGAGLFIVDGNLIINSDLSYQAAALGISARELASVGWLVTGNVIISPAVNQAVGAFFITSVSTSGIFSTGASSQQLVIYGAVIAKQFQLERTASAGGAASERVIADGRVLLNTPPGFMDILKTLPTWQFRTP